MVATLTNQVQIRKSRTYDDSVVPSEANFETNSTTLADDVNNIVSALNNLKGGTNWYDNFDNGTVSTRDVATLGTNLNTVETKAFLFRNQILGDVAVPALQNWVVLGVGEIPTTMPFDIAAIALTTEGAVSGDASGGFNAHSLAEIAGSNALNPKNLVIVRDATTFDAITSDGREVFALFQVESGVDGDTISTTTGVGTTRAQVSFVRSNAAGTDLEAVPVGDIAGATINYAHVVRLEYNNIPEQAFLTGLFVDQTASSDVNLTNAIANQVGEAPQNQDIDVAVGAGNSWDFLAGAGGNSIANFSNAAGVATVTLGSSGTATTTVEGTTLDINVTSAVTIAEGLVIEDGANPDIRIGGLAGAGTIDTDASVLTLDGAAGTTVTATAGNVALSSPAAVTSTSTTSTTITASDAADASANAISLAAGSSTAGGANGAAVNITAGDADTTGTAGNVVLTAGASATGTDGFISVVSQGGEESQVLSLTNNDHAAGLFVGDNVPNTVVTAPAGSLFQRSNGQIWVNTDGATAWSQLAAGATTATLDEVIDNQGVAPTTTTTDVTIGFTAPATWEFQDTSGSAIAQFISDGAGGQVRIDAPLFDVNSTIVDVDSNVIDVDSTLFLLDASGSISLDAEDDSNFTVDGANLTMSTATSGNLVMSSAGDVDMDAANILMDATAGVSIDAAAASNFTVAGADLTLATTGAGNTIVESDDFAVLGSNEATGGAFAGGALVLTNGTSLAIPGIGFNTLATDTNSQSAIVQSGNTTGTGVSGFVGIQSGTAEAGGSGGILVASGNTTDTGASGSLTHSSGSAVNGNSGSSGLQSGDVSGSGTTGVVNVSSGLNTGTGDTGNVVLQTGMSSAGTSGNILMGSQPGATGTGQVQIFSQDVSGTAGAAGDILIVGGAGGSVSGNGASVLMTPGSTTGGTAGVVGVDSALANTSPIFRLDNADGSNGIAVDLFTSSAQPNGVITGDPGDMVWVNNGGAGEIWLKVSGSGTNTGWQQVDVGGVGSSLQSAYEAGNTIVTDVTNGALDVSGTEAISLDAGAESNFTVAGANLNLQTSTSGNVAISSAGDITNNATGLFSAAATTTATVSSVTGTTISSSSDVDILSTAAGGNIGIGTANSAGAVGGMSVVLGDSTGAATVGGSFGLTAGSGSTTAAGGGVSLQAGQGGATGDGGVLSLQGGTGGSTSGTGGELTITGGSAATLTDNGGNVSIDGGLGGTTSGAGGRVEIDGGAGNFGGDVIVTSGAGNNNASGLLRLRGADSTGSGQGGAIALEAGDSGGTSPAGTISIQTGTPTDADGGDITMVATNGVGTDRDGGAFTLTTGTATGTGTGGGITMTSGSGGAGTGSGGGITMTSGNSSTTDGDGGNILITAGSGFDNSGDIALTTVGSAGGGAGTVRIQLLSSGVAPGGTTTDNDEVLQLINTGTNGGQTDIHTTDRDPTGNIFAQPGSLAFREDGVNSGIYVHVGASANNTDWAQVIAGISLQGAYEQGNTIVTTALNGGFDVSGTEGFSLDGAGASNVTVAGANLTLETTGTANTVVSSEDFLVLGTSDTSGAALASAVFLTTEGVSEQIPGIGFNNLATDTNSQSIAAVTGQTSGTGVSGAVNVSSGGAEDGTSGLATFRSGDIQAAGTGTSGGVSLFSGNATGATNTGSGSVQVSSGTSLGGITGNVVIGSGANTSIAGADSGDVMVSTGNSSNASSGDMAFSTGSASGGALVSSGDITFTTGGNSGDTGLFQVTTGTSTADDAGSIVLTTGDSNRSGEGTPVSTINLVGGSNSGDDEATRIFLDAGDNTGAGAGGLINIQAGDSSGTAGNAGGLLLQGGDASGTTGNGGSVSLVPGTSTNGTAGVIQVDSALANTNAALRLDNSDGTNGTVVDMFVSTVQPNSAITGDPGDLAFVNNGGAGQLWVKSSGSGTNTGWEQIVAGSAGTRVFFQDTLANNVTAGNDITAADMTGAVLPSKPAGLTFDTEAQIFINGVLQFNGTGNDVSDGPSDDITLELAQVFAGDVLTIIYMSGF